MKRFGALLFTSCLVLVACSQDVSVTDEQVSDTPAAASSAEVAPDAVTDAKSAEDVSALTEPVLEWDASSLPTVSSKDDLARLLPQSKATKIFFDDRTTGKAKTTLRAGPLGLSDWNVVDPEPCSDFINAQFAPVRDPSGAITWFGSRSWATTYDLDAPDEPQLDLRSSVTIYQTSDFARQAFDDLALSAVDCAYTVSTRQSEGVAYDEWFEANDVGRSGLALIESFGFFDPRNADNPAIAVDVARGVLQLVSGAPTVLEADSASTFVLAGDRIIVTTMYSSKNPIDDEYASYLAVTQQAVSLASGVDDLSMLNFASLAEIPEISNASRPPQQEERELPSVGTPDKTESIPAEGVHYEVSGSASQASMTYRTGTGSSQVTARLPWRKRLTDLSPGAFLYVSAQNQGDGGSVSCKIYVNGRVVSDNTSSGAYAVVTCESRY
jgi:hypothetical protein